MYLSKAKTENYRLQELLLQIILKPHQPWKNAPNKSEIR